MGNMTGSGKADLSGDKMSVSPSMGTTSRACGAWPEDGADHSASIAMPSMGTSERKKGEKKDGADHSHGFALPSAGTVEKK